MYDSKDDFPLRKTGNAPIDFLLPAVFAVTLGPYISKRKRKKKVYVAKKLYFMEQFI